MITDFQLLLADGVEAYIDIMIGRIYKILPLFESDGWEARRYAQSFLRELIGFANLKEVPVPICEDADFFSILCTLKHIRSRRCTLDEVRSDVFKCISLCKALKRRYFGGEQHEL